MSNNPHQPKPHESDEELLQDEEDEQKKVEEPSDRDVEQVGSAFKGAVGGGMLYAKRFSEFKKAYNTLTDSKLVENLLDLDHPENLAQTQSAVKISRHELDKKGNKARGYTESRFLFWKSDRLTPDQLYRARYSTILAKRLHLRVNQTSNKNKIEGFIQNFAATDQEAVEIRKSLEKWRKDHPGKSLDKVILAESKRIKKGRGEGFGRKEEEEIQKQLKEARGKAVEEYKAETTRTADQIKYTLDLKNPAPPASQLRPDLQQIQTGQIATSKLTGGFAEIPSDLGDAIMGYDLPVKKIPTPAPTSTPAPVPPKLNLFSSLSARWSNFKDKIFSGLRARWSRLTEGISNFFKPLADRIKNSLGGKLLGKFFGKLSGFDLGGLAKKALKSLAVKAGLGAATGGVATVLDTVNDVIKAIFGFDLEKTLAWGVLLLIIGVPLLVILLVMNLGGSSNTIPNYGVQNSMKVSLKNPTPKYAWSDFERDFLTARLSWEDFEKNYLQKSLP